MMAALAAPASIDAQPGFARCAVQGVREPVWCATVSVPEDRANPGGRSLALRVVMLRSTSDAPARHTLFYLVGGPGLAATTLTDIVAAVHANTRATHDIILVDHRGTGGSNALDCAMRAGDDVASYLTDQFPADAARACAARITTTGAIAQYSPASAAEDLEAVRAHVGADAIDIDASSYGTRVALEYMRRYPRRVRSAVLQGAFPDTVWLPATAAADAARAMDRLLADCAADPFCRTSFPGLRRELTTILERTERPVTVRVKHPRSDDSIQVSIDRNLVADRLRILLYSARLSRRIPIVIHQAFEGDWTPFVLMAYELSRATFDPLNNGAHLAVMCADAPRTIPNASDAFLGDYRARMYARACAAWPRASRAAAPARQTTTAPVLLVTGALDPVTPPRFAESVARSLPNATVLTVPGMAHAGSERCVEGVVSNFIRRGTAAGLDTSCVQTIKPAAFVTSWR